MRTDKGRAYALVALAAFLLVVASFPVVMYAIHRSSKSAGAGSAERPIVAKSPSDLEGTGGKTVQLTGKVQTVTGGALIVLNWGAGTEVHCTFPGAAEWMATAGPGEELTVRGRVTALMPGLVFLDGCERVKR